MLKMNRIQVICMLVVAGMLIAAGMSLADDAARININTATVEQLVTLDGIGEAYARRIVEYRKANGPFTSIDQIKEVKGIGEKTFEKNKDKITVGSSDQ